MKLLLEFPDALFHAVDEGSIHGDDEVWSSQARCTVRKGHNFRSDRWIAIKLLLEFPDVFFHGLDEGSILVDDEVWSCQAGWTVRKGDNFRSDRWIGIKLLLEFPDAFFHEVDEGSILDDDEVRSGRARLDGRFKIAITFDPTVGSRSNFYWSFQMPFSMQWMRNRFSVMRRSGRAWLE